MKTALILAAVCLAYVAAQPRRCPLMTEIFAAVKKCHDSTNFDQETMMLVHDKKGLDDEKANCFRACILNESGLLKDATFDFSRMTELLNSDERADPERTDRMVEKMKSCQEDAETSDNECTVAGKYAECVYKMMPPHGRGPRNDEPE